MNETPREPVALEYGRGGGRQRLWRAVLKFLCVIAFIGLAVATIHWGPRVSEHLAIWSAQSGCLTYTAPPDQVVCEENPHEATELLGGPGSAYVDFWTQPWPAYSKRSMAAKNPAAVRVPAEWKRLAGLLSPHYLPPQDFTRGATIFMHERSTRAGERRLVIVQYIPNDDEQFDFLSGLDVEDYTLEPATLWQRQHDVTSRSGVSISRKVEDPQPEMRIFAGQIDPADSCHFTVEYEAWGQRDTLDGWVENNGSITLKTRHPPVRPK